MAVSCDRVIMEQRETDVLVDLGFDVPYPDRNYTPQPLA